MSGIRIVLFDELYKTNSLAPSGIELLGQIRLDQWLGPGKVKFEVAQLAERQFKFTIWREYGPWWVRKGEKTVIGRHVKGTKNRGKLRRRGYTLLLVMAYACAGVDLTTVWIYVIRNPGIWGVVGAIRAAVFASR